MKIRKNDLVVVRIGRDASPTPRKVLRVLAGGEKVVVEGVNRVYRHIRRNSPKSPQGGRLSVEMPISAANVRVYCSSCNQAGRVGLRYLEDGSKERVCKKCNGSLGKVSPARTRYAKVVAAAK